MQIEYERGISNPGNLYRMKNLMARAEAGETLNIGFLGGSLHRDVLRPRRSCVMLTAYFSGGKKHFRRQSFIISMPESVERHRILEPPVQSPICFRMSRILSL